MVGTMKYLCNSDLDEHGMMGIEADSEKGAAKKFAIEHRLESGDKVYVVPSTPLPVVFVVGLKNSVYKDNNYGKSN